MNIQTKKQNDKFSIKVVLAERKKIDNIFVFKTSDAVAYLSEKYDLDVDDMILLSSPPHDLMNHTINLSGEWVFELKQKHIDIKKDYVKINQTMKADSSKKEQEKEASLPYGLKKQAKPKRKRATTKKKTEE